MLLLASALLSILPTEHPSHPAALLLPGDAPASPGIPNPWLPPAVAWPEDRQGDEVECRGRGAAATGHTQGSGIAHWEGEGTPCTLRGHPAHSGDALHAQGTPCTLRTLSVPCSPPGSVTVTSPCDHSPLLALQQLIPTGTLESPSVPDCGMEGAESGGSEPPRLPRWV